MAYGSSRRRKELTPVKVKDMKGDANRMSKKARFMVSLAVVTLLAIATVPGGVMAKKITVGVSVPTLANPFWENYVSFQKQVAAALDIDLVIVDANNREDKQLSDIESLIARGVDGIVFTPQTASVAPAVLAKAEKAGIPVMVTDRWPGMAPSEYKGKAYIAFVGPDDVQAGYDIAKALYDAGCRSIVAIHGFQGNSVTEGRKKGLHDFLAQHKDMKLLREQHIGELREQGMQVAESYLSAFKPGEIDGIWCYNDDLAMGAVQAAKNAGRLSGIKVAGMDLNPTAIQAIKAGDYLFSTGGHWLQGGFGLIMLYDAINGHKPEEGVVKLKLMGVTKETVQKFLDQYINNPPQYDFKSLSKTFNPNAKTYFEIKLR